MFTNLMSITRDSNGDGIIDGRSTDPLNPDTDGDGLKDGIEVVVGTPLVVNGVQNEVTSDQDFGIPMKMDCRLQGVCEVCGVGSNASNADTDGDGLGDQAEALNGFSWYGGIFHTYVFDTDNDGLEMVKKSF